MRCVNRQISNQINTNISMKKYILYLFFLLQLSIVAHGDETLSLSFSKDQYSFVRDSLGRIEILSLKQMATYGSDELQPGLPLLPLNVALSNGNIYKGTSISIQKKELVMKDVDVAPNPKAVITGSTVSNQTFSPVNYTGAIFPDSNVEYVGTSEIRNVEIARFQICPFIYDSNKRELYLIEKLDLHIETEVNAPQTKANIPFDEKSLNMLKAQVYNGSILSSAKADVYSMSGAKEPIKYLIITNKTLTNGFQELADWKKTKGINSKIVTVEEIDKTCSGKTLQEKIKRFIYNTYISDGLQYVLLGGDDTVVPVQYCYCHYTHSQIKNYFIPSDSYYSCFGGNFEWDANGNGLYGEPDDEIDFTQDVYIARAPVRTPWEAHCFSEKVVNYEQNPIENGLENKMLSMGYDLDDKKYPGYSEKKGEYMYNHYIKDNWNGKWFKFYNSGTNLPVESNYEFIPQNIQEQLSEGYAFVDVIAHGSQMAWGTGVENSYTTYEANNLDNRGYSIITTSACLTNAFDQTNELQIEPCLSESLIRNGNSGVIAYLGCSREGWEYFGDNQPGPSTQYTCQFYKNLFSSEFTDKNFGYVSALAKSYFVNNCIYNGLYRWIQLGLNAIGDPEMPIYTEDPKEFSDANIKFTGIGRILVDAGTDGATICILEHKDVEQHYYKIVKDKRSVEFSDLPDKVTICITKQNFVPKVYNVKNTYIQNENVSTRTFITSDGIFIGSAVTNSAKGPVEFSAPSVRLYGKEIIMTPDITLDKECDFKMTNTK